MEEQRHASVQAYRQTRADILTKREALQSERNTRLSHLLQGQLGVHAMSTMALEDARTLREAYRQKRLAVEEAKVALSLHEVMRDQDHHL